MPACGKPDGTDFIGINAKLFGIGPQETDRGLAILNGCGERSFSTKTVGNRRRYVTAGSQSLGDLRVTRPVSLGPASSMNANDRRQFPPDTLRSVDIHLQRTVPIVSIGQIQLGVQFIQGGLRQVCFSVR